MEIIKIILVLAAFVLFFLLLNKLEKSGINVTIRREM